MMMVRLISWWVVDDDDDEESLNDDSEMINSEIGESVSKAEARIESMVRQWSVPTDPKPDKTGSKLAQKLAEQFLLCPARQPHSRNCAAPDHDGQAVQCSAAFKWFEWVDMTWPVTTVTIND